MKPLASTLEREADRVRHERLEPAVERAREKIVEDVPEAASRAAHRARRRLEAESRQAAERLTDEGRDVVDRVESYFGTDESDASPWGARILWTLAGFLLGFLAGWLWAHRGNDDRDGDGGAIDVEPAPAGIDVASREAARRAGEPVES